MPLSALRKIISGGQTGADRAALDFAIAHGIPHSGWCPKGRKAEDGAIDARYALTETPSTRYSERTEWNVRDSDGTVVFSLAPQFSGGSKGAEDFARKYGKPFLHLSRATCEGSPARDLLDFIRRHRIGSLNVAGPRGSEEPEIGRFVTEVLEDAFKSL